MTSTCSHSAPPATIAAASSASRAKSQESSDGDILVGGIRSCSRRPRPARCAFGPARVRGGRCRHAPARGRERGDGTYSINRSAYGACSSTTWRKDLVADTRRAESEETERVRIRSIAAAAVNVPVIRELRT